MPACRTSPRDHRDKGSLHEHLQADEHQTQGPPRRVYHLTAQGDEMLRWWTQDLQETRGLIDQLLGSYRLHMAEGEGDYH